MTAEKATGEKMMRLVLDNGEVYRLHFTHDSNRHWTECQIHKGECAEKGFPCKTPGATVAIATVHPNDTFSRAAGRYWSFKHAVEEMFSREEFTPGPGGAVFRGVNKINLENRRRLWKAFFFEDKKQGRAGIFASLKDQTDESAA
jgi:hypothetical protein